MDGASCTACESTKTAGAELSAPVSVVPQTSTSVAVSDAGANANATPQLVCGPVADVDVAFASASADLLPESKTQLTGVVRCIKEPIEVAGHADATGATALNLRLSAARAEAAKQFLVASGIDSSLITVKGYGESQPAADNSTAEGRAKNRRIALVAR